MFSDLEKNIIIMALMYLKSDYTQDDLSNLGLMLDLGEDTNAKFEQTCQTLIEDLVGPIWDEEGTAKAIKDQQLKLFRDET